MPSFNDYIVYVDESGDHSLSSVDEQFPIFSLAFCIYKKEDYAAVVAPALQRFKFKWFGHDLVILHENDIAKKKNPFGFLQYDGLRERFMQELGEIVSSIPMTIIASVIRKDALKRRYTKPENPYQLALLFCLEKTGEFLSCEASVGQACHVVCESRSPRQKEGMGKEDRDLELEFRRIVAGKHYLQRSADLSYFDIVFASKSCNSTGLQIADLIARPIGLRVLRPDQENRAFSLIRPKIWAGPSGGADGLWDEGVPIKRKAPALAEAKRRPGTNPNPFTRNIDSMASFFNDSHI